MTIKKNPIYTVPASLQWLMIAFAWTVAGFVPANSDEQFKRVITSKMPIIKFTGICDGSAAVSLDKKTILVAYDEKNILFSFDAKGGKPLARIDLADLMKMPSGNGRDEIDIEAGVRVKEKIWWIGSHSQSKDGERRPNRRMIFSTNLPGPDLQGTKVIDAPVDLTNTFLANTTLAKTLTKKVLGKPPKQGGISIEGLAQHPLGGLVVGFRSPLAGSSAKTGPAMAVHIIKHGDGFHVKTVYDLYLGNRGIRDIVRYKDGYLLIAGATGNRGSSVLFTWQPATGALQQITNKFKRINPEALVSIGKQWLILSDDGKQKRPDSTAPDGDRKCDKIRKKTGKNHRSVYFNAVKSDLKSP